MSLFLNEHKKSRPFFGCWAATERAYSGIIIIEGATRQPTILLGSRRNGSQNLFGPC